MKKSYFVTGTDTGVGKTWATVALMRYFKKQGKTVVGMKPVAAGCEWIDGQLKNSDALLLQQNSSVLLEYKEINPYAFEEPVSPHLAAMDHSVKLDTIVQGFEYLARQSDVVIVEGAGGWLAPLNKREDIADLVKVLNIPVIMVVAIRLGCINHARLTFQSIQAENVECAGWVAICLDPLMEKKKENIATIENKISVPLLGVFPYLKEIDFEILASNIVQKNI